MSIDTREELINALREACVIEHGLMVQYLYAALTMRRTTRDGLTTEQQVHARRWQAALLGVAHDEMVHLSMVCHILMAIGGVPKLDRPNLPQDQDYYPFKFDLIPFSDMALYRFMVFELPRNEPQPPLPIEPSAAFRSLTFDAAPVPDRLEWQYVGGLYTQIADGLTKLPEPELFIRPNMTGPQQWFDEGAPEQGAIRDRVSAANAIRTIIEQGEGSPENPDHSHYRTFTDIRADYRTTGMFEVAKNVPINPATREHREAQGTIALIPNEQSRAAVEAFNAVYALTLFALQFQFSLVPNTASGSDDAREQLRKVVRYSCKQLMTTGIRPMAEIVTEFPFDEPESPARVGPSFEIYSDLALAHDPDLNRELLIERFDPVIAAIREIGAQFPRATAVADTLSLIKRNIDVGEVGIGL